MHGERTLIKICKHCNIEFLSKTTATMFCSHGCFLDFRREIFYKPPIKCLICGIETNNPKFCSRNCAGKKNIINCKGFKMKPRERICGKCGEIFWGGEQKVKTCKDCLSLRRKNIDMTLREATYLNQGRRSAYALIRSRARSMFKEELRDPKCFKCGYNKYVEVCHIKPICAFTLDTMVSEINSEENLILLCPNCHWEFDHAGV